MAGLVLAMIVGVLVPPLVVSVLASRDPLPRDCSAGRVSATKLDGAILRTTGADLWYSEGNPGQPRKLLDFAPHPARLSPGTAPSGASASPTSAAASPEASAVASPGASAGPSPGPPPAPSAQVLAADIAADRHLVAILVLDPPDRPGFISMRMLSPLDPPGKAPVEGWYARYQRDPQQPPLVRVLDNNKVLLVAGVPRASAPAPSPAVSPEPTPSPTPSPSPSPSASLSPSPSPSQTASASPSISPSPSPSAGEDVVIVVDPGTAVAVDQAPLDYFLSLAHSGWADTKGYRVPPALPALRPRVDGPISRVAATVDREAVSPLARRRINQVVLGTAGRAGTTVVCAAAPGTVPLAFSPDEAGLALFNGRETLFLDLTGAHAATRLLDGRILAWRA